MKKTDQTYLVDIIKAANKIANYIIDGKTAFLEDIKTQDAVCRNFEIMTGLIH